jgi:membrane-bound ClpP family serine protease
VDGESWSATSDEPIPAGSPVKVVQREGLILKVELVKENKKK